MSLISTNILHIGQYLFKYNTGKIIRNRHAITWLDTSPQGEITSWNKDIVNSLLGIQTHRHTCAHRHKHTQKKSTVMVAKMIISQDNRNWQLDDSEIGWSWLFHSTSNNKKELLVRIFFIIPLLGSFYLVSFLLLIHCCLTRYSVHLADQTLQSLCSARGHAWALVHVLHS